MIRRPPRSTPLYSSAASDVYKRQSLLANSPTRILMALCSSTTHMLRSPEAPLSSAIRLSTASWISSTASKERLALAPIPPRIRRNRGKNSGLRENEELPYPGRWTISRKTGSTRPTGLENGGHRSRAIALQPPPAYRERLPCLPPVPPYPARVSPPGTSRLPPALQQLPPQDSCPSLSIYDAPGRQQHPPQPQR